MPNWCENYIKIDNENKDMLNSLFNFINGEEEYDGDLASLMCADNIVDGFENFIKFFAPEKLDDVAFKQEADSLYMTKMNVDGNYYINLYTTTAWRAPEHLLRHIISLNQGWKIHACGYVSEDLCIYEINNEPGEMIEKYINLDFEDKEYMDEIIEETSQFVKDNTKFEDDYREFLEENNNN